MLDLLVFALCLLLAVFLVISVEVMRERWAEKKLVEQVRIEEMNTGETPVPREKEQDHG